MRECGGLERGREVEVRGGNGGSTGSGSSGRKVPWWAVPGCPGRVVLERYLVEYGSMCGEVGTSANILGWGWVLWDVTVAGKKKRRWRNEKQTRKEEARQRKEAGSRVVV